MYERELELAKQATLAAGKMLGELPEREVDEENGRDIKLHADRLSEKVIIETLKSDDHDFDVLSEEMGLKRGEDHGHTWIIDPLDGSANFSKGLDELCCVSVALWKNGGDGMPEAPAVGVIYRFATEELYSGIVDRGAYKYQVAKEGGVEEESRQALCTSNVTEVGKAILATGFPVRRNYSDKSLSKFVTDIQRFKKIRMLGTAAMMGAFVAEGKMDAYMEEEIMLWDVAASAAIVKAAGGRAEINLLEDNKTVCRLCASRLRM